MPVPEAPVDKHHGPVLGQHDVWGAWQVLDVHTVPESPPPERTPEGHFRLRIHGADVRHQLGSLLF